MRCLTVELCLLGKVCEGRGGGGGGAVWCLSADVCVLGKVCVRVWGWGVGGGVLFCV